MSADEYAYLNAKAHFELASNLMMQERWDDAERELRQSLQYVPDRVTTLTNLSAVLLKLRRFSEAKALIQKTLAIDPENPFLHMNSGLILWEERQVEDALKKFELVIKYMPNSAEAWLNRGYALRFEHRWDEALFSFSKAFELDPDGDFYLGVLVHAKMHLCDWIDLDWLLQEILARVKSGRKVATPFATLGLFDSPDIQRLATLSVVTRQAPLNEFPSPTKKGKIRVGYFSMDFCNHPVSFLLADLIEAHDRGKFEIYAFSFGEEKRDEMRNRLEKSFDKFLDVKHLNDLEIVKVARESEIDIAIDLAGHTNNSRPEIFALRVAPIQINYLGYPGTWGNTCMDYIIGDRITVTRENREHFSERVIFLPNSFQVNSRKRDKINLGVTRQDCGLPEGVFVFCCLNNTWKITPEVFSSWLRILFQVPTSVLWLYVDNPTAERNLTENFRAYGLSLDRLVFFQRLPRDEYLSRYRLADLFLDTYPYNAGTTASDALWMGLPVLTLAGYSFVSRMAMSLLSNIGSDLLAKQLVTHSRDQYEAKAVELAMNPGKLIEIRSELSSKRAECPLFDTDAFAQHLESAFQTTLTRHEIGLPPKDIFV